ncbi:MAG: SDR family NAD(P)-dependent oxidoreductase [Acidobacteriota bacterium]|nr:SDR family NAD(P)-dependent oxidoreductase [Acidobacteriota bacterium]MDH3785016.1 SDR family NAD(P)-dependent oxidoreductase [Acidobacteriota bacterium]
MNILFLGATGGMGQVLARALAADGHRLVLLGRDEEKLHTVRAGLIEARPDSVVETTTCDLADPAGIPEAVERAAGCVPTVDAVVVAAGKFAEQGQLETDRAPRLQMLEVNFRSTIEFCECVRPHLLEGGGTLCVYTSVAAVRARGSVALYGATKAGLDYYLDGIGQRYQDRGLRVVRVRPGFVKTPMTAGLKPPAIANEPEETVASVMRALRHPRHIVYTPPVWRYVMTVIRLMPRWLLRRSGI